MTLLQIKNCGIQFGGLKALSGLSFDLAADDILGVIGPNGAGKTTLFNLMTGVFEPTDGEIFFDSICVNGHQTHEISRMGVARTFQNIRLFGELTVADNVMVAFYKKTHYQLWAATWRTKKYLDEEDQFKKETDQLLDIFGLHPLKDNLAKNLSYGDQRRLEIARALATSPKLLLLDEPAAGMNAVEKKHLVELIRDIQKQFKLAVLIIEHDMSVVMNLCPRIVVLDYGQKIAEGTPDEIRKNKKVIEAYLGDAS